MTYYDLNMNSKRINNCQDPSAAQDVATKNYVDTSPVFNKAISGTTVPTAANCGNTASYIDLATVGPSVTITTGTSCCISFSCNVAETANDTTQAWMSFAVSGATTQAASDTNSITVNTAAVALPLNQGASISRTMKITGLTAGSNTFTAKYKATCAGSGVITFSNRDLVVFP